MPADGRQRLAALPAVADCGTEHDGWLARPITLDQSEGRPPDFGPCAEPRRTHVAIMMSSSTGSERAPDGAQQQGEQPRHADGPGLREAPIAAQPETEGEAISGSLGWKRVVIGGLLLVVALPFLVMMTVILSVPIVTIPLAIAVIFAVVYFILGASAPGQSHAVRK